MNNQYSSLLGTFIGQDIYNLPMPALPPADLSLGKLLFTPKFMGDRDSGNNGKVTKFDISENPYVRSFGFFSNLADGLVDGSSSHNGGGIPLGIAAVMSLHRYSTPIQLGSITLTAGSKTVTGVGTAFVASTVWTGKDISFYDDAGNLQVYTISTVTSATVLTLTAPATTKATGVRFVMRNQSLSGTIANTAGSATVTGTNTKWLTELAPGLKVMWLDDNSNVREGTVSAITSNTAMTLTAVTSNLAASMWTSGAGPAVAADTTAALMFLRVQVATSSIYDFPTLNQLYSTSAPIGDVSFAKPIRGTVSFVLAVAGGADTSATGVGTMFTKDVVAGQGISYIDDAGVMKTVLVGAVVSDTVLTITTPAANVAGVATVLTSGRLVWNDAFWAVHCALSTDLVFYTISIDPAFGNGTRRISFSFVAEIEHNQSLMQGMFA